MSVVKKKRICLKLDKPQHFINLIFFYALQNIQNEGTTRVVSSNLNRNIILPSTLW